MFAEIGCYVFVIAVCTKAHCGLFISVSIAQFTLTACPCVIMKETEYQPAPWFDPLSRYFQVDFLGTIVLVTPPAHPLNVYPGLFTACIPALRFWG